MKTMKFPWPRNGSYLPHPCTSFSSSSSSSPPSCLAPWASRLSLFSKHSHHHHHDVCGMRRSYSGATCLVARRKVTPHLPRTWATCAYRRYNASSSSKELEKTTIASPRGDDDSDGQALVEESLRYWNDLINRVDRPTARMMLSKIDRDNITGVDTSLKGVSTSKNSLYQFLLR